MSTSLPIAEILELLERGEVRLLGVLPYASNYTYLTEVKAAGVESLAVYKPRRGERPLWDFPGGTLAAREEASFRVSAAAEWGLVPPTVLRADAPLGEGSLQIFIDHDPDRHYLSLMDERLEDFRAFAAFDAVVNNADRKSGHVLEGENGHLWGVDHGLTFHVEPKLRTVIWEFAEEPLDERELEPLRKLQDALQPGCPLYEHLSDALSGTEAAATAERVERLLTDRRFPSPPDDHHPLPWPLV